MVNMFHLGRKRGFICFLFSALYFSRHVAIMFLQLQEIFAIDSQLRENLTVGPKIMDQILNTTTLLLSHN